MPDPVSVYPDAIDGYAQLPLAVDKITPVDAYTVNSLRSAIVNIETELGISPKGEYSTVRERLDAGLAGGGTGAEVIVYDNATSGLTAENVQDAIDELSDATPSGVVLNTDFLAKGSILVGSAAGAKLSLGAGVDSYILSADSSEPSGVKWTPAPPSTDNDALHDNVAGEINAITAKATGVSADQFVIEDSADSNNKKKLLMSGIRITESQITDLTHTDSDSIHDNVAGEINSVTLKATGVSADQFIIEDSADSNNKKKLLMSGIRITESQITDLTHTDSDSIHDNVAGEINAIAAKAIGAAADQFVIEDSADSNNKKKLLMSGIRITESQITDLSSGDADAIHDNVAGEINAITEKTSVTPGDLFLAEDTLDSNNKKKILWSTIVTQVYTRGVNEESSTPVTVNASETGQVFTNEDAAAEITFNLPTASAGLIYSFICQNANLLNVTAAAGDTIRLGSQVTITAGKITATAVGDSITLIAINATEWMVFGGYTGLWDVETS